jgi:hypothetical protein
VKLGVLFWCYKHPDLCRDRVEMLRRDNPDTPIYVLFGGEPPDAPEFERALGDLVQDFYVFDDPPPPSVVEKQGSGNEFRDGVFWKYEHGDLMLRAWHRDRGCKLPDWDTVVVVQWDMLVFGKLEKTFACLKEGEVLLSGVRPIGELEDVWLWTSPKYPERRARYLAYLDYVKEQTGFEGEALSSLPIVMCYPRTFFDRWVEVDRPDHGFLEYSLPTWARAFDVPLCEDHPFIPWWGATDRYTPLAALRALPREIWVPAILLNLMKPGGARVFHPYWRPVPRGFGGWLWAFLDSFPRIAIAGWTGLKKRMRRDPGLA